jgi:hypothetical protein
MVSTAGNYLENPITDNCIAYGDLNLFCSCSPVQEEGDLTGAAAPAAT